MASSLGSDGWPSERWRNLQKREAFSCDVELATFLLDFFEAHNSPDHPCCVKKIKLTPSEIKAKNVDKLPDVGKVTHGVKELHMDRVEILDLPLELQRSVFGFCDMSDLKCLSLVCHTFHAITKPLIWKDIRVKTMRLHTQPLPHEVLHSLGTLTQSVELADSSLSTQVNIDMNCVEFDDQIIIDDDDDDDDDVWSVCKPNSSIVHWSKVYFLGQLSFDLRRLKVSGDGVDDRLFYYIKDFVHLRLLDLSHSQVLGYLEHIKDLKNLETLLLSNCLGIDTDRGIKELKHLVNLKHLNLDENNVSIDMMDIQNLTSLEKLSLGQATIGNFHCISTLNKLKFLNLSGLKQLEHPGFLIDNTFFTHIEDLPLTHLYLYDITGITDQHLCSISKITSLQYLYLENSGFDLSDEGICFLKSLHHLVELNIRREFQCQDITDVSMRVLSALPSLRNLKVAGCNITEEGKDLIKDIRDVDDEDEGDKLGYDDLYDDAFDEYDEYDDYSEGEDEWFDHSSNDDFN